MNAECITSRTGLAQSGGDRDRSAFCGAIIGSIAGKVPAAHCSFPIARSLSLRLIAIQTLYFAAYPLLPTVTINANRTGSRSPWKDEAAVAPLPRQNALDVLFVCQRDFNKGRAGRLIGDGTRQTRFFFYAFARQQLCNWRCV